MLKNETLPSVILSVATNPSLRRWHATQQTIIEGKRMLRFAQHDIWRGFQDYPVLVWGQPLHGNAFFTSLLVEFWQQKVRICRNGHVILRDWNMWDPQGSLTCVVCGDMVTPAETTPFEDDHHE